MLMCALYCALGAKASGKRGEGEGNNPPSIPVYTRACPICAHLEQKQVEKEGRGEGNNPPSIPVYTCPICAHLEQKQVEKEGGGWGGGNDHPSLYTCVPRTYVRIKINTAHKNSQIPPAGSADVWQYRS